MKQTVEDYNELNLLIDKLEQEAPAKHELKYRVIEVKGVTTISYWYAKIPFDWKGYAL